MIGYAACAGEIASKTDNNEPLTLEQLEKMDGQKVLVVDNEGILKPEWHIVDVKEKKLTDSDGCYWCFYGVADGTASAYRNEVAECSPK